jgi:hypothetical protein
MRPRRTRRRGAVIRAPEAIPHTDHSSTEIEQQARDEERVDFAVGARGVGQRGVVEFGEVPDSAAQTDAGGIQGGWGGGVPVCVR